MNYTFFIIFNHFPSYSDLSFIDGKCYKPMNLLIALDVSGSIQPDSWQSEIDLSKEIVRSFAIQSSGNKFAIMDFSTEPNVSKFLKMSLSLPVH